MYVEFHPWCTPGFVQICDLTSGWRFFSEKKITEFFISDLKPELLIWNKTYIYIFLYWTKGGVIWFLRYDFLSRQKKWNFHTPLAMDLKYFGCKTDLMITQYHFLDFLWWGRLCLQSWSHSVCRLLFMPTWPRLNVSWYMVKNYM